ncbi:Mitotic checkpoint serine/threonine protein kinase, Bub1 [Ophiocordyceps camponoti-floridani]|uniref:Mitotic checkpoint serine/threonine protein kinase, Bub1 n=1 Tax=Ophiocordyceps camponoti-floridani TaxID=2030778 RepID=A0A8H4VFU1_9HYPO|nr:Mitotic checkpoint serine/threonine protein kinase, Bub1 [Ophiocordyceps camponoti-floridani]
MAAKRGWLPRAWDDEDSPDGTRDMVSDSTVRYDENGAEIKAVRGSRPGKKKVMEVNETQIIKAKLDSPSGPKLRKKSTEPTMTIHTRAATDEIYDIFNAPLHKPRDSPESADEDEYETDGDYTTDAESTGTTRPVDVSQQEDEATTADVKSPGEWTDVVALRHALDDDCNVGDSNEIPRGAFNGPDGVEQKRAEQLAEDGDADDDDDDDDDNDVSDQDMADSMPRTRTVFTPLPPEDYNAPTRPYRDPVEVANCRLPFMTPITERTECSLDCETERERLQQQTKTPCKRDECSSTNLLQRPQSPVIKDRRCNPVDEAIRRDILNSLSPPLASYHGFHDRREQRYERGSEIRKYIKAVGKAAKDKTAASPDALVLRFPETRAAFSLKRELGVGAFAPVYLVEKSMPDEAEADDEAGSDLAAVSRRSRLEALKMESPPSAWEFHMMRLAHDRLGSGHRAAASLSHAHELHLYRDEAFLFLPFHGYGTLLDVVNLFHAEPSGVMDELLAMFFAIELLRTVDALHAKGILHGDLKPDNCLLRVAAEHQPLETQWEAGGGGGWAARGVVLIDFGRSIDMMAFSSDVEFIADWKTGPQDCPEMRESRPWTWQIDYHGLAATIHCLLFGKYMETTRCDQGNVLGSSGRKYRIRESLKRYWQTDLWADLFDMLLNPLSYADGEHAASMPLLRATANLRNRMERWLEANCDRGVGLRSLMSKLEAHAKESQTKMPRARSKA